MVFVKRFPLFLFFFLISCGDSPIGSEKTLLAPNQNSKLYSIYPNDFSANDSINKYFSDAVLMKLQPDGNYFLSFNLSDYEAIPTLRLFHDVRQYSDEDFYADVVGEEIDGEVVYNFVAEDFENMGRFDLVGFLMSGDDYFDGNIDDFHFQGYGNYPTSISINVIFVGKLNGYLSEKKKYDLANSIKKEINSIYDVDYSLIDQVNIVINNDYSNQTDSTFLYRPLIDNLDTMSSVVADSIQGALDFVIINSFSQEGVLGLSPIYGLSLENGKSSTITLATSYSISDEDYVAATEYISNTAAHELGHFFGLRHTTSTSADLEIGQDYSNVEDGLSDTYYCSQCCGFTGLFKSSSISSTYISSFRFIASILVMDECLDSSNLMFPASSFDDMPDELTSQQLDIVRKNISLYPR